MSGKLPSLAEIFDTPVSAEQGMVNVARILRDATEVKRQYNGRGRAATRVGGVEHVALTGRQLAEMVLAYFDTRGTAVEPELVAVERDILSAAHKLAAAYVADEAALEVYRQAPTGAGPEHQALQRARMASSDARAALDRMIELRAAEIAAVAEGQATS